MTFFNPTTGQERGTPPTEGQLPDGRTVSGITPNDVTTLAACGWYPVTAVARPAATATDTADRSVVDNNGTWTETWTVRPWTADELTARVAAANRATIEGQALTALDTNTAFLAIAAPTNALTLAQVKALTRQNNKLIRLLINKLDGTK